MRNIKEYAETYLERPFENIQVVFRKKKVVEIVNSYVHRSILEVGCGSDPFFNCYNDFEKLVIVEPSITFYKSAIDELKSKDELNSKIILINDYIENIKEFDFEKYNFDFVIISSLLHEIEDTSLLLEKLQSFISSNTIVHVNVPNAHSFHRVLAYEMGIINSIFDMSETNLHLQQQRLFDLESLSDLITNNGFEIIESGSYFLKPFTHEQMAELLNNNIINP